MRKLVNIPFVFVVIVFVGIDVVRSQNDTSPCGSGYNNLTYDGLRYLYNIIDSTDSPINDEALPEGWYSSGEVILNTTPTNINMCGTRYPIWLNGDLPTNSTPEPRTACLFTLEDDCLDVYDIQIVNCLDFYLYYLIPTERNYTGYCFGIGDEGQTPGYVPQGTPEVIATLLEVQDDQSITTQTVFICNFYESQSTAVLYAVQWYIDGNLHYTTPYGNGVNDTNLHVTEDVFIEENFRMGVELSCRFFGYINESSWTSSLSQLSDSLFIGIEILTSSLTFEETEQDVSRRTIRLRPTIPIGCMSTSSCNIRLHSYIPESGVRGVCTGLAFQTNICGVDINSATFSNVLEIPVVANDNGQYNAQTYYEVFLRTEATNQNKIWGNYSLPSIPVAIVTVTNQRYRRPCYAVNDPHLSTFDGRYFDDHTSSEKILYRNIHFNTEVQIKYKPCFVSHIRCICGVAIKAGYDVYVYDLCDGFSVGYTSCSEQGRSFTVQWDGTSLKVYFNYGTYIIVYRDYISYYRIYLLRASVYPSRLDEGNTRGLCGIYNYQSSDDFHARDGSFLYSHVDGWGYYNQPSNFLSAWRVTETENMFSDQFDSTTLQPYTTNICVCESGHGSSAALSNEIPCHSNGEATCRQSGRIIQPNQCSTSARRRRRSSGRSRGIPVVKAENLVTTSNRFKRQTTSSDGWTADEADSHCNQEASSSEVYNLCSDVPSASSDDFVEICSVDIELTNDTVWVQSSMNSVASDCLEEMSRNVTTLETQGTESSIIDQMSNLVCPNNCSENGACQEGSCVCDAQVGGDDCSIDLSVAPSFTSMINGGLCDQTQQDCSSTSVYGGIFVESENLKYNATYFEVTESGERTYGSSFVANATFITFVELECDLSLANLPDHNVSNDAFLYGFTVSVTNIGDLYSESTDYFVYSSECQAVEVVDGSYQFTLIAGYCYIDNGCVSHGLTRSDQLCDACNTTQASQWPECQVVSENTGGQEDIGSKSIVVAAIIGGGLLLVFIVIVIALLVKQNNRYKNSVGDSTLSLYRGTKRGLQHRKRRIHQRPLLDQPNQFE